MIQQQVQREARDGLAEGGRGTRSPRGRNARFLCRTLARASGPTISPSPRATPRSSALSARSSARRSARMSSAISRRCSARPASIRACWSISTPTARSVRRPQAAQRRDAGLNENLAREILELHTMGVGSGYTQADIIEFAKALTGWTIGSAADRAPRRPRRPGRAGRPSASSARPRRRCSRPSARPSSSSRCTSPARAPSSARPMAAQASSRPPPSSTIVARHPATARHIATKLVRHFVADQPPPSAVAKIEAAWKKSDGHLGQRRRRGDRPRRGLGRTAAEVQDAGRAARLRRPRLRPRGRLRPRPAPGLPVARPAALQRAIACRLAGRHDLLVRRRRGQETPRMGQRRVAPHGARRNRLPNSSTGRSARSPARGRARPSPAPKAPSRASRSP